MTVKCYIRTFNVLNAFKKRFINIMSNKISSGKFNYLIIWPFTGLIAAGKQTCLNILLQYKVFKELFLKYKIFRDILITAMALCYNCNFVIRAL